MFIIFDTTYVRETDESGAVNHEEKDNENRINFIISDYPGRLRGRVKRAGHQRSGRAV